MDGSAPRERERAARSLLLFSCNSVHAQALVVELLGQDAHAAAQLALSRVLSETARNRPDCLSGLMVDPLIALLGADSVELRRSASLALADFPAQGIPKKLGDVARDPSASTVSRLAAVDALALGVHQRNVVAQLVSLLEASDGVLEARLMAALERAAQESFGNDKLKWRAWWAEKSKLDEKAWQTDQVRRLNARVRDAEQRLEDARADFDLRLRGRDDAIVTLQREVFRTLDPAQQEARLSVWLSDPLDTIKQTAVSIIRARIADVGYRPSQPVLEALLTLLRDPSPAIRRESLTIIPHVDDPAIPKAVLAQLSLETDTRTRTALLAALGKLASPSAIPAIVAELARPDAPPECVREAALALGQIAGRAAATEQVHLAVEHLKARYAQAAQDDSALRSALLVAMAGVADGSFADEFRSAADSDDPAILRPALHGLAAIGDTSKLPRLRDLTAHADPRVRIAAVEAIGRMGRQDADIERLLHRLNPAVEQDAAARSAAWTAFRTVLAARPIEERIIQARRLRDIPGLEVRYLSELAKSLGSGNGNEVSMAVQDRLAEVLVAGGQYGEATAHLRALYESVASRKDQAALAFGLRWLDAALHAPTAQDRLAALIDQIAASAPDDAGRARIVEKVAAFADAEDVAGDASATQALHAQLSAVTADSLGASWTQLLGRMRSRFEPPPDIEQPESDPPPAASREGG